KAVVLELARQAQEFHAEAAELCPHLSGDGRRVYEAMHRLYGDLLRQILVQQGDVFARRPRLSGWLSTKTIAVSICRRWLGR
ncbi:MAG: squalene/phytoene synthase family protein, partial [Planctomycetaceae bacterium]|nr:squalene/phytoene synthase family protein [Planctomycetaceae bacterium]